MSAEGFLDTNLLVHTLDHSDPGKRHIASASADPKPAEALTEYLELVLLPHGRVHSSAELCGKAVGSIAGPHTASTTAS